MPAWGVPSPVPVHSTGVVSEVQCIRQDVDNCVAFLRTIKVPVPYTSQDGTDNGSHGAFPGATISSRSHVACKDTSFGLSLANQFRCKSPLWMRNRFQINPCSRVIDAKGPRTTERLANWGEEQPSWLESRSTMIDI